MAERTRHWADVVGRAPQSLCHPVRRAGRAGRAHAVSAAPARATPAATRQPAAGPSKEPRLPAERRPDAEFVAWSAVHGLAVLLIGGPLHVLPPEHADAVGERLLDAVLDGL